MIEGVSTQQSVINTTNCKSSIIQTKIPQHFVKDKFNEVLCMVLLTKVSLVSLILSLLQQPAYHTGYSMDYPNVP